MHEISERLEEVRRSRQWAEVEKHEPTSVGPQLHLTTRTYPLVSLENHVPSGQPLWKTREHFSSTIAHMNLWN